MINKDFVFECTTKQSFLALHTNISDDICLEMNENVNVRITDEKAQMIFQKQTGCKNEIDFLCMSDSHKQKSICELHKSGLSIRQICLLTGLTKHSVIKSLK